MRPNTRLASIIFAVALVSLLAFFGTYSSSKVEAVVRELVVQPQNPVVGSQFTVKYAYDVGTGAQTDVVLMWTAGLNLILPAPFFSGQTCPSVVDVDARTVTHPAACLPLAAGVAQATFVCTAPGVVGIAVLHQGDSKVANPVCTTATPTPPPPGPTPTPGPLDLDKVVTVSAHPNVVPCGGGTSEIRARMVDDLGRVVPGVKFEFKVAFRTDPSVVSTTDGGALTQISDDTAVLTLFPGARVATVAARALGFFPRTPFQIDVDTGTITGGGELFIDQQTGEVLLVASTVMVRMDCLDPDIPPGVAVVVTADPNVVPCGGGTSAITATLRDRTGRIIEGVGFHFAVEGPGAAPGILSVGPPNTASVTAGRAVLTLLPEMYEATVIAAVGTTLGTVQGTVTVKQYCPGSATTPGNIVLTASSPTIGCGGSTFIGARVRDVSGNPARDDTEIRFLATAGSFDPDRTVTRGGALSTVYRAPANVSGAITIQAAGGAAFGSTTIQIDCPGAPSALTAGAGIISPPSTGAGGSRITPPNTGGGGLR